MAVERHDGLRINLKIPKDILEKLIKEFPLPETMPITMTSSFRVPVFNHKGLNGTSSCKSKIQICEAIPQGSKGKTDNLLIKMLEIDQTYAGDYDIYVKRESEKKLDKWPRHDSWKDKTLKGQYYKEVNVVDLKKITDFCETNNITSLQFIQFHLDNTFSKAKILMDLYTPLLIYIPTYMNQEPYFFQKYNNHMILFTNSNVGKTSTVKNITKDVFSVSEKQSEPGLIGSPNWAKKGALAGKGVTLCDEINKNNPDKFRPIDETSTYQSDGILAKNVGEGVICEGTKAVLYGGNCNPKKDDVDEEGFEFLMIKIATFEAKATEKLGRRFGSVVYGPLPVVSGISYCGSYLSGMMRKLVCQTWKEIMRDENTQQNITSTWKMLENWINEADEHGKTKDIEYFTKLQQIKEQANLKSVSNFIEGMQISTNKLRFHAIRMVQIIHIFEIFKGLSPNKFKEMYFNEILYWYDIYKEHLYDQLQNIVRQPLKPKKERIIEYLKEKHININERLDFGIINLISDELLIKRNTVDTVITELRKEQKQGIERT